MLSRTVCVRVCSPHEAVLFARRHAAAYRALLLLLIYYCDTSLVPTKLRYARAYRKRVALNVDINRCLAVGDQPTNSTSTIVWQ